MGIPEFPLAYVVGYRTQDYGDVLYLGPISSVIRNSIHVNTERETKHLRTLIIKAHLSNCRPAHRTLMMGSMFRCGHS